MIFVPWGKSTRTKSFLDTFFTGVHVAERLEQILDFLEWCFQWNVMHLDIGRTASETQVNTKLNMSYFTKRQLH